MEEESNAKREKVQKLRAQWQRSAEMSRTKYQSKRFATIQAIREDIIAHGSKALLEWNELNLSQPQIRRVPDKQQSQRSQDRLNSTSMTSMTIARQYPRQILLIQREAEANLKHIEELKSAEEQLRRQILAKKQAHEAKLLRRLQDTLSPLTGNV
jgi:hypothetical protein